ncbi:O-antigen ligase family protein [Cryptosporangium aurantiacum]|uniref:O-antigen ligase n=1 Tax=Cryptosporangium aurantiacum TaxID=134849 RepID=A0A1M7RDU2_9ACTN|nr:O-antigen ligase family protein [Cryptosporangium aurantiacum]SHN44208.1 O-antigen ligase [Cryptosporangium aurantiacum]
MVSTIAGLVAGGVVAASLVAVALLRPAIILVVTVALDATNLNAVIEANAGISPFKPMLALVVLALFVLWRQGKLKVGWSPVLTALLVLVAAWFVTMFNSADPPASWTLFMDYANGLVYFALIYALLCATGSWKAVLSAVVGGLALIAALTIVHQVFLDNAGNLYGLSNVPLVQEDGAMTPRHAGTAGDVNFWARILVTVTPLALSLWAINRGLTKLFWVGATLALIGGLFLTQSRGGFLAVLPAVVVWFIAAGGKYRRQLAYLPLVLLVAVPVSGVGGRLATLADVSASSNIAAADPSLVTRARLQEAAWRMFLDAPGFGHGMGTYGSLFPQYDRYSDQGDPVTIVVASHNFYLEQAADGGLVLLAAWAIFFGAIFFVCWRVSQLARSIGRRTEHLLAVGVASAVAGWLASSVFLHLSDLRVLLLLAGIAAALDVRVRWAVAALPESERAGTPPPPRSADLRVWTPRVLVPAAAVFAVLAAVSVVRAIPTTWSAELESRVSVTAADEDWLTSYQRDLVTRGQLVPSFAVVANSPDFPSVVARRAGLSQDQADHVRISLEVSRQGGAITVHATAREKTVAEDVAVAAGQVVAERVRSLNTPYVMQQPRRPVAAPGHPGLALGMGACAVALLLACAALWTRRRPEPEPEPEPEKVGHVPTYALSGTRGP